MLAPAAPAWHDNAHPLRCPAPNLASHLLCCPLPTHSYGLVRVRENAESIAFYGGEDNEARLLNSRLQGAVDNFLGKFDVCLTRCGSLVLFDLFDREEAPHEFHSGPCFIAAAPPPWPCSAPARIGIQLAPALTCALFVPWCRAAQGLPEPAVLHILLPLRHPGGLAVIFEMVGLET